MATADWVLARMTSLHQQIAAIQLRTRDLAKLCDHTTDDGRSTLSTQKLGARMFVDECSVCMRSAGRPRVTFEKHPDCTLCRSAGQLFVNDIPTDCPRCQGTGDEPETAAVPTKGL